MHILLKYYILMHLLKHTNIFLTDICNIVYDTTIKADLKKVIKTSDFLSTLILGINLSKYIYIHFLIFFCKTLTKTNKKLIENRID